MSLAGVNYVFLSEESGGMYAKIYEQIFDSSIAENYQVRHVFEDLLKLADQDGTVNRTHEAIARRTNVPLDIVKMAIAELEKPDTRSQSRAEEGRRLVRLDPTRDWGWKIVNHGYYRALRTADEKRQADKDRQRNNRSSNDLSTKKLQKLPNVTSAFAFASTSESLGEVQEGETSKEKPSTEQEVIAYCLSKNLTAIDGEYMWAHWEGNGFTNNKLPMKNWKGVIRSWALAGHLPSTKPQNSNNGKFQHPPEETQQDDPRTAARYT